MTARSDMKVYNFLVSKTDESDFTDRLRSFSLWAKDDEEALQLAEQIGRRLSNTNTPPVIKRERWLAPTLQETTVDK